MEWINQLEVIEKKVIDACGSVSRDRSHVQLVVVTKTHSPELVRQVLSEGLLHIGENKVQELKAKKEFIGNKGFWHLIGHLQSNKVKHAVRLADSIDAVDSTDIAKEINQRCEEIGKVMPVLIEVNVSGELSKFGVTPTDLKRVLEEINSFKQLELRGLMTMAPFFENPEHARPVFAGLRELRDKVQKETGILLPELSMGMSHDFTQAIQEGATQIRLGSAIFGSRPIKAHIEN